jgi:hypothetical protein
MTTWRDSKLCSPILPCLKLTPDMDAEEKCLCEGFFSNGLCGHSTLMALLYDSALEFPGEWSTQQLPNSGKKNKRPSAWAEFHEEEERQSRTERWAPRQLGLGDMVISRTLKVHSAFSVSLQCLTSASFTETRR